MSEQDRKPTLRPVPSTELVPSIEDRVRELERAMASMLRAQALEAAPAVGAIEFAPARPVFEIRWPTVDELEYFSWLCLAAACFALAVRTAPGLLGVFVG